MFSITERAAQKALQLLRAEGKEHWGLRVYVSRAGG
jgi:Fe-S cluster assembly iron-binding protein IscA